MQVLGPKKAIAPGTVDDDKVDNANRKKGALYMVSNETDNLINCSIYTFKLYNQQFVLQISDASGTMKVSCVAPSSPFKQAMLSPEECYILDNGVDSNIFVWKGEDSVTCCTT